MRPSADGLLDLYGVQVDSVLVGTLPVDVEFKVAIRLQGTAQDFAEPHVVQVVLSDPGLVELGRLDLPVHRRGPSATHLPGYELNHVVVALIAFTAEETGGYDLSFAIDGQAQHRQKATISVVMES